MKKVWVLLLVLFAVGFWGCSSSVDSGTTPPSLSSSDDLSPGGSSGSDSTGSSSSLGDLPTVEDNGSLPDGPSDLEVSILVAPNTMVLTWTDVARLNKNDYDGYQIWRNESYRGWRHVGFAKPEKGFFKDSTLDVADYRDGQELKYQYRIIAYKDVGDDGDETNDSLISLWSNLAGSQAVTTIGFDQPVFENPDALEMIRWAPGTYSTHWSHSGLAPELGFVIQRLSDDQDSVEVVLDKIPLEDGDSLDLTTGYFSRGDWMDLDTLGPTDNHFSVYNVAPNSEVYRVYAFYSYEFGNVISEYTNEVVPPMEYAEGIDFKDPPTEVTLKLLSDNSVRVTWTISHNVGTHQYVYLNNQRYQTGALSTSMIISAEDHGLSRAQVCEASATVEAEWIDYLDVGDTTIIIGVDYTGSSKASDSPECADVAEDNNPTGLAPDPVLSITSVDEINLEVKMEWDELNTTRSYDGFVIERDSSQTGWLQVGLQDATTGFYTDGAVSMAGLELYRYRIYAFEVDTAGDTSRVSGFSNIASTAGEDLTDTVAVPTYSNDLPSNLQIERLAPTVYELTWRQTYSGKEQGFAIQRQNFVSGETPVNQDNTSDTLSSAEGSWEDIDTVASDQNYFRIVEESDSVTAEKYRYRVYAVYSGGNRSEYTNEVQSPDEYRADIVLDAPTDMIAVNLDTTAATMNLAVGWTNAFENIAGDNTDELMIEIEVNQVFGTTVTYDTLHNAEYANQVDIVLGSFAPNDCDVAVRARYIWKDIFGGVDVSPWSDRVGTRLSLDPADQDIKDYCGYQ